jgi:hypothetical protein
VILMLALAAAPAVASQSVSLAAKFVPKRLGGDTGVGFEFTISAQGQLVPSPLTGVELRYPQNLGIAISGLGIETCDPQTLELEGAAGCPANSRMGYGEALAEIPIGGTIVREPARVEIVRGPTKEGHLALLFYADGESPTIAQIVLPGLLLPATPPFGGSIGIDVPLVPGFPEGPNVSVVSLKSMLGPRDLTYYERVRGRTIAYKPRGIVLPRICPRGGFRFMATFSFLDGSSTNAATAVPCPAKPQSAAKRPVAARSQRRGRDRGTGSG